MVRRSRRVEGQHLGPLGQSPAAGIRRFFAGAAGTSGGKMAPAALSSAAARGRGDKGTQSMPSSPSRMDSHRATNDETASASLTHQRLQQGRHYGEVVSPGREAHPPPPMPQCTSGDTEAPSASPLDFALNTQGAVPHLQMTPALASGATETRGRPSPTSSACTDRQVSPLLHPISAASSSPASLLGNDFYDLKAQLAAIPTKQDMEGYIQRLELAYKSEIQALTNNLSHVADQAQRLEGEVAAISTHQESQDRAIEQNTQHIHMLFSIAEDHENRNRRNNLRVRGIPESVTTPNIMPTLNKLFNNLLGDPEGSQIEMDRAHRTLGPKNPDPNRPRDVVCRLHYFTVKEQILRKARDKGDIHLDGCKIQLLADLSKMTLDKRRALRPLLDILRDHEIAYSWGYPFQLQVRIDGTLVCVRSPADVPEFCDALRIPMVSIRDWPFTPLPPQRPQRRRRGRSPPSPRRRPREEGPDGP